MSSDFVIFLKNLGFFAIFYPFIPIIFPTFLPILYLSNDLKEDIYMNTKGLDYTILTIAIIGAINWGLVGFFKIDLIALLFGEMSLISRVIYSIVGLCGLYLVSLYGRVSNAMTR